MLFKVTDLNDRHIGDISAKQDLENGFVGRFHPGPDFLEVKEIFEDYTSMTGSNQEQQKLVYERLVALKPRLIPTDGGNEVVCHAVIVSDSPNGYSIAVVEE